MLAETIVVIGDNPRNVNSIKTALKECEILEFPDGESALSYLNNPNEVNLALLCAKENWPDDIRVLEEIKEDHRHMSVIVITAYASKDLAIAALRSGADDFLEEPIIVDELRESVSMLLMNNTWSNKNGGSNNYVERIKKFVEKNHHNASLENVAQMLNRSPKYISRLFKDECASSFRDFKLRVKMDIAKSLLKDSDINITNLSYNLGYKNPESFLRIFKRMTSLTPTQYRREVRNQ